MYLLFKCAFRVLMFCSTHFTKHENSIPGDKKMNIAEI